MSIGAPAYHSTTNKEKAHLAHGGDDILGKAAAALEHIAGATTLAILEIGRVNQAPLFWLRFVFTIRN